MNENKNKDILKMYNKKYKNMYVYINLFIIFFYCILILLTRIRPCEKK